MNFLLHKPDLEKKILNFLDRYNLRKPFEIHFLK